MVGIATLGESDLHPICPKTQVPQYQLTYIKKEDKGKTVAKEKTVELASSFGQ